MKESTWKECLENFKAVKITPNKAKTDSLLSTAKERITFLQQNKLNKKNAHFIFEGYYTSALEILHALVILAGFKVDNHICLGYYLRDILLRKDLFQIFEDCRYKRNSIVYYGKKPDFDISKEAIQNILRLIKEVLAMSKKPKD